MRLAFLAGVLYASVSFLDVWLLTLHEGCSCYLSMGFYSLYFIIAQCHMAFVASPREPVPVVLGFGSASLS